MASTMDVRRAADRAATRTPWLNSRHSFSFNDYYDPDNTHHGLLLVNNDDVVAAGAGFDTHPHRNAEIITWVLSGALAHADSIGNSGVVYPGLAQRMSAGTGILHSERNDSADEPVHFVQMWVMPDQPGRTPGYQQCEIGADLSGRGLVAVASGREDAAIGIGNRHVTLYAAQLSPGERVELPDAPFSHLFVARGRVSLEDAGALDAGDAVRFTGGGGQRVSAEAPAEVLLWSMHGHLGG